MTRPETWTFEPLGDQFERVTYGFTNPMPTTDEGPFMVTAKDVRDGRIDYSTVRRTAREAYETLLTDKSRPRVGDLLLTKDGSIGRLAVCDRPDVCINQSVALLQPKPGTNVFFMKYLLSTDEYQAKMAADADGSTIKHIYVTRVDKMLVPIPPPREQEAIAEVLGALDDKIAANTRIAETATSLGEALFDRASQGAESVPLTAQLTPILGGTPPRDATEYWDGDVPWVSVRDISSCVAGAILETEECITWSGSTNSRAKTVPAGSVILSARGTVGAVARLVEDAAFNQSCYAFSPGVLPAGVLFYVVRHAAQNAKQVSHGSVFSTITVRSMGALPVPQLADGDALELEELLAPLLAAVDASLRENRTLVKLRDTLLPALMDGTIRVKDAISQAEGVL